jgi:hypothetical protein
MRERDRQRIWTPARLAGASALAFAAAGLVLACAPTPDTSQITEIAVSQFAFTDFAGGITASGATNAGVQGFLANKCGTLDCHGSSGRSLRIFSQYGLRLVDDAGDIPGGAPTTPNEIFATYISAISVQPELTTKAFHGDEDPHSLLLLRKPLGLERHKGGQVLQPNDYGDLCLTSWLTDGLSDGGTSTIDNAACNTAAQFP